MKHHLRNIFCGIALVVLLAILTISAFAAGTTLTVVSPETIPGVGGTFTVQVAIAGNPGLQSAQYTLSYDKSVVECQKVKLGSVLADSVSAKNPNADIGAIVSCAATEEMTDDGVMSEYTFKVLSSEKVTFGLAVDCLQDANGKRIQADIQMDPPADDGEDDQLVISKKIFSDVPACFWASEYIEKAVDMQLLDGSSGGTFCPDREMTRAEFVAQLYKFSGAEPVSQQAGFKDVAKGASYRDAVNWAKANGYITGDGVYFHPNNGITRQQMVTILYRYYHGSVDNIGKMVMNFSDPMQRFTDRVQLAPWAEEAMQWAVYYGIIKGTSDTTLRPRCIVTRAQAAAVFVRCAEKFNGEEETE